MQHSASKRAADPRPARTRAAIYQAVEMLAADPAAEVSINAIVRMASVSRSAFYTQFSDLDDLAVAMLVDAFSDIGIDDVRARTGASADDLRTTARASATRLVAHIAQRRSFYRASLEWRLSSRVHETVVDAYATQVLATAQVLPDGVPDGMNVEDAARFVAGGTITVLTSWLREESDSSDDRDSRERLVERLLAVMPTWLVGTG